MPPTDTHFNYSRVWKLVINGVSPRLFGVEEATNGGSSTSQPTEWVWLRGAPLFLWHLLLADSQRGGAVSQDQEFPLSVAAFTFYLFFLVSFFLPSRRFYLSERKKEKRAANRLAYRAARYA